MSPRSHLPAGAWIVVRASRMLPPGVKLVWEADWSLDSGPPEHAWIGHAQLADRLGLQERTVKDYREALRRIGLHESVQRAGARNLGWISTLPAEFVPRSDRPKPEIVRDLADRLDQMIAAHRKPLAIAGRRASATEADEHRQQKPTSIGAPPSQASADQRRHERGVRGESAVVVQGCETTLQAPGTVRDPETGELPRQLESGEHAPTSIGAGMTAYQKRIDAKVEQMRRREQLKQKAS